MNTRLRSEELVRPEYGSTITEIGKDVRRRLKLEPVKVVIVEVSPMPAGAVRRKIRRPR